jgi:hypothetical protein
MKKNLIYQIFKSGSKKETYEFHDKNYIMTAFTMNHMSPKRIIIRFEEIPKEP